MQQRYHSLDFLRAIMMFLGIILHGAQMYLAELAIIDYYIDPMRSVSIDATLIIINTFRMPIFFFLSGFFIALLIDKQDIKGMLDNRLKRIALPFTVLLLPLSIIMGGLQILGANWLATKTISFDLSVIDNPMKLVDKTHNLWFLYYLTMHFLSLTAVVVIWKKVTRPANKSSLATKTNNWLLVAVAMATMSLLLAIIGSGSDSGRISASLAFKPDLLVYFYFGVFFVFGWALYYAQWVITAFDNHCWQFMLAAILSLIAGITGFALQGHPGDDNYYAYHLLLCASNGVSVTLFIAAFIGLFQRYFSEFSETKRYLSDSAYWVFCSHSIFLVALAIPMAYLNWPAEVKFLIVITGTCYLCLFSYKYFVRSTWLGQLLNGRRY
jgi:glucan biosynthesis protein C